MSITSKSGKSKNELSSKKLFSETILSSGGLSSNSVKGKTGQKIADQAFLMYRFQLLRENNAWMKLFLLLLHTVTSYLNYEFS